MPCLLILALLGACHRDADTTATELDTGTPEPPGEVCTPPAEPVDTSSPDHIVGTGTPESCTESALQEAVNAGGSIRFDCGDQATIDLTAAIQVPTDRDVTLDGQGLVTLDGGHSTRLLVLESLDYRVNTHTLTLQGLTLQNAQAPASDYTPQDPDHPECAWGYKDGEGGAVYVRDGVLHVFDCVFRGNRAATPGPDTGGGAIFAVGSLELLVVGSVFEDNQGSNGGAVGLLQTDGLFYNSRLQGNRATGTGANFGGATGCPDFNHAEQGGAGGNGGAIAVDGGSVERLTLCGVTLQENIAGALGTLFRTPNSQRESTTIDRCNFVGNHTADGGGAIYTQDMDLVIEASTFYANGSTGSGGAIRLEQGAHGSTLTMRNSTLYDNGTDHALGGGLVYAGPGSVTHCTFARNHATGGYDPELDAAYFGAAISGGGFEVRNSVFVDNHDTHPWTPMTCNIASPMLGSPNLQWPTHRLDEDGSPSDQPDNPCTVDITWADAALLDLTDNGGPTWTAAPSTSSPARGVGVDCLSTDQRGEPRPAQGCTLGAVE